MLKNSDEYSKNRLIFAIFKQKRRSYESKKTYQDICTETTGHAEAVRLYFDPDHVSYKHLLDFFFNSHDPTSLNRQGPNVGYRYRSAIFYHNPQQKIESEAAIQELNESGEFDSPVVTQIVPATIFYKAEDYHQQYYEKQGIIKSCSLYSELV